MFPSLVRCMEMQPSSSVSDFQQLWESVAVWLNRLYDDPRVKPLRCHLSVFHLSTSPPGNQLNCVFLSPPTLQVAQLMNTRVGQYLQSRPVFALAALLFAALAAVPLGIFLTFALVTVIMSAVGFVFFAGTSNRLTQSITPSYQARPRLLHPEMFVFLRLVCVLFVGGVSLLSVLSGIALFSVVVSFMVNLFYIAIFNVVKCYNPHLAMAKEVRVKGVPSAGPLNKYTATPDAINHSELKGLLCSHVVSVSLSPLFCGFRCLPAEWQSPSGGE